MPRQQLRDELWPAGTFVDFEAGLNSIIRRWRRALGVDNAAPRCITTVPGSGYCFIAPVAWEAPAAPAAAAANVGAGGEANAKRAPSAWRRSQPAFVAGAVAFGLVGWVWLRPAPPPRARRIRALTTNGGMDTPAKPASDRQHLYYLDRAATGNAFTNPVWLRDGRYLYDQDLLAPGEPVYRWARGRWRPELVAEFSAELRAGIHRRGFMGLAPDGAPLISFNRSSTNLYAADLSLP